MKTRLKVAEVATKLWYCDISLNVHYVELCFIQKRDIVIDSLLYFMSKQTKRTNSFCIYVSCLFLHVADPATFLASNSVLDLVFLLDGYGENKYIRVCLITLLIVSEFEFRHSSKTTQCPFNVHSFYHIFHIKDKWGSQREAERPEAGGAF